MNFKPVLLSLVLFISCQAQAQAQAQATYTPLTFSGTVDVVKGVADVSFSVPSSQQVLIHIPFENKSDISDIQYVLPNGKTVNSGNGEQHGVMFYNAADDEMMPMNTWMIAIENVKAGEHKLKVFTHSAQVAYMVTSIGNIRHSLLIGDSLMEVIKVDKPIRLGIHIVEGVKPVTNAIVNISLKNNDVDVVNRILVDNGKNGDAKAKDGIYELQFTPSEKGTYALSIEYTGFSSTNEYLSGTTAMRFVVVPASINNFEDYIDEINNRYDKSIKVSPDYIERLIDKDGDGLIDKLELAFTISGDLPAYGAYSISGDLDFGDGRVVRGSDLIHVNDMETGVLRVSFPGLKISDMGYSGRIKIARINVSHQVIKQEERQQQLKGRGPITSLKQLEPTQYHESSIWQREKLMLLGNFTESLVDTNGNYIDDHVKITFDVNAALAGTYSVQLYGYGSNKRHHNGTILFSEYLKRNLHSGVNTVQALVSLENYKKLDVDETLDLALTMYLMAKTKASIYSEKFYRTQKYSCDASTECDVRIDEPREKSRMDTPEDAPGYHAY